MKFAHIVLLLALSPTLPGCSLDPPSVPTTSSTMTGNNYMEYEGQRFLISKEYTDWDDFKEDPNNYLGSETPRMGAAVRAVQFLPWATRRETVMKQMFDKQFPGFGCGQLGILNHDQLDSCAAFFVEIPRTELNRYVGYAKVDGEFVLVADFEAPQMPMIAMVAVDNNHLVFHGMDKSVLRREPIKTEK